MTTNTARHALVASLLFTVAGCTTTPLVGTPPVDRAPPPTSETRPPAPQAPSAPSTAAERERSAGLPDAPSTERASPEPTPSGLAPASLALLEQGRSQRVAGSYAAAESSIERALRIDPNHAELWLELGEIKLADGDFLQARQMAQKAVTLAGANPTLAVLAERLSARASSCGGAGC
jgi:hypothetical protein